MKLPDKRAVAAWLGAGLLLLGWSAFAYGENTAKDDEYDDAKAAAVQEANFWHVVAGDGRGAEGPMYKLARDLNQLEPREGDTLTLALMKFRGDSNRYGGITDDLGYDPFNGDNCSECGPLDSEIVDNVQLARSGKVSDVIASLQPEEPEKASGAPWFLWLVWLVSLPASWFFIERRRTQQQERRYADYDQEMALIKSIDETLHSGSYIGPGDDLLRTRDELMDAINKRIRYGEQEAQTMKIEALRQEARDTLDAVTEGNKALER